MKWACEAGYGVDAKFRSEVTALGRRYVGGVKSTTTVWAPGTASLPPPVYSGRGRRPVRPVHDDTNKPVSVEELALGLPKDDWRKL